MSTFKSKVLTILEDNKNKKVSQEPLNNNQIHKIRNYHCKCSSPHMVGDAVRDERNNHRRNSFRKNIYFECTG